MTIVNDEQFPMLQYLTADNIHSAETVAVFATRNGGISGVTAGTQHMKSLNFQFGVDGENDENVFKNYQIMTTSLGFSSENVAVVSQMHTDKISVIDEASIRLHTPGSTCPEADALVTDMKGVLLSVRTADCVPILLYDPINKAVAAVHSGWRGAFLGIAAKTLRLMKDLYSTNPAAVKVAIGPAIGPCCYEVSSDLHEQFVCEYGESISSHFVTDPNRKPYCDLIGMNKAFLAGAGVHEKNFDISDLCTMCNPNLFFSHRHSGYRRGTMSSFIGMRS